MEAKNKVTRTPSRSWLCLPARTQGFTAPRPVWFWARQAAVAVTMLLLGFTSAVLLLCLVFIIRLYIVVKTGANCKPGSKGRVTVLVVAGSGNSAEHGPAALRSSVTEKARSCCYVTNSRQPASVATGLHRAWSHVSQCFSNTVTPWVYRTRRGRMLILAMPRICCFSCGY